MRYWITAHWPHRIDQLPNDPHVGVYAQDRSQDVIQRLSPGDHIWIYEARSGRTKIQRRADGTEERIPCHEGREGIVGLAAVTGYAIEVADSQREQYADGSSVWWRYYAPTEPLNLSGFVTREELNHVLGYASVYNLRGFGDGKSGIKEIPESTSARLLEIFLARAEEAERRHLTHPTGSHAGGSGEGPEHLALKQAIATDPSAILGEPGLTLVDEEWPFSVTGDKIDVLLKDAVGRYLAVEVEVDCDAFHLAGPLQCMKYRAMLAYRFRKRIEEVRCMLVAHTINADVRARCSAYGIEIREVPRAADASVAGRR